MEQIVIGFSVSCDIEMKRAGVGLGFTACVLYLKVDNLPVSCQLLSRLLTAFSTACSLLFI